MTCHDCGSAIEEGEHFQTHRNRQPWWNPAAVRCMVCVESMERYIMRMRVWWDARKRERTARASK